MAERNICKILGSLGPGGAFIMFVERFLIKHYNIYNAVEDRQIDCVDCEGSIDHQLTDMKDRYLMEIFRIQGYFNKSFDEVVDD